MVVGGDLGDGLLLLDLGLFGQARGDLVRSGLLAGLVRGKHCLAFTGFDSFPDEIVHLVHAFISGDQSGWDDVFEGFVQFAQELHKVRENLHCGWPLTILVHLDLVQEGRDVALDKSQGLPLQLLVEELRRFSFSFWHV